MTEPIQESQMATKSTKSSKSNKSAKSAAKSPKAAAKVPAKATTKAKAVAAAKPVAKRETPYRVGSCYQAVVDGLTSLGLGKIHSWDVIVPAVVKALGDNAKTFK